MWTRLVSVLVGLALVGSIAAFVSRSAQRIAVPELQLAAEACDPAPAFQIIESPYDSIYPTPEGWTWKAQGYIGMHPCQGGTLTISGYGVEAGGDWPLLIASLDTKGLGSWKFDRQRNVMVDVSRGGRITLAFLDAYGKTDDQGILHRRELYLTKVRFIPRP